MIYERICLLTDNKFENKQTRYMRARRHQESLISSLHQVIRIICNQIWAATWQNQKNDCAPSEDSDQPGHPPSLIRVFAVHMKKAWVLSYPLSAQRRLWSDWANAQADLRLRWVHTHLVGFVKSRLICVFKVSQHELKLFFFNRTFCEPFIILFE